MSKRIRCKDGNHAPVYQDIGPVCFGCGRNSEESEAEYEEWLNEELLTLSKTGSVAERERWLLLVARPNFRMPMHRKDSDDDYEKWLDETILVEGGAACIADKEKWLQWLRKNSE